MDTITPGQPAPPEISRIELLFVRKAEVWPEHSGQNHPIHLSFEERLVIDRASDTLTYTSSVGRCTATYSYHTAGGTETLLHLCRDYFHRWKLPHSQAGSSRHPTVSVSVRYANGTTDCGLFRYNRTFLPDGWDIMMEEIRDYMRFYRPEGDLFSPEWLEHGVKPGEYIYCSVEFEPYGKTYYYRTADNSLRAGDSVIVPAGQDNAEKKVTITEIKYFTEEDVPFPLEKTKFILRKAEASPDSLPEKDTT
ncbi:hypothetical protein [Butyricicoccus sp.]|uniref:hypothetical protein n=1 Tax=Butyricicoccus sp. TaxID=2049021 RepID=UPI003F14B6A7